MMAKQLFPLRAIVSSVTKKTDIVMAGQGNCSSLAGLFLAGPLQEVYHVPEYRHPLNNPRWPRRNRLRCNLLLKPLLNYEAGYD